MPKEMSDKELDKLLEKEEEKIRREKEAKKPAEKPEEKAPPEKPKEEKPEAKKEAKKVASEKAEEKIRMEKESKRGEAYREAKPEAKKEKPAAPVVGEYNPWGVLLYPHLAEKSMNMVELENKLVFIVNKKASKREIKEAVEKGFDVRVAEVKTEITTRNLKKAYVKLAEGYEAADVASRLGMI